MHRHFHEELEGLKEYILKMALLVEESVKAAVDAFLELDSAKHDAVMSHEEQINAMEIEVDDRGHRLLGLEQPVAVDLRRIIMILKINTDLERMNDHAVNVVERSRRGAGPIPGEIRHIIRSMGEAAMGMLKNAIDSFVREDAELARAVLKSDDVVDDYNDQIYRELVDFMGRSPGEHAGSAGIDIAMVAYNLERVADLASNIAEDVIYIKQGKEVRHHLEES
ncbi:MAG: phosphate signaling complex protein PhoU [Candidatus Omnitrophica bacterium]|nr:phosphate signaling complex protein PhoU [Candidatus Omnitrophota bacterium]